MERSTSLFETCIYIGCHAASGTGGVVDSANNASLVDAVFARGFAGRSVQRVDGVPMKYWENGAATATNSAGLIQDANGQCGSWAELFMDVLATQGITGAKKIGVYAASNPAVDGFLVKDWTFIGNGSSPGTTPYVWVVGSDAIDSPNGASGQGNPNPPGAFYNHFIVKYAGRFFDPSYGGPSYATQWEWEDASLDGFFRDIGTQSYAKKNDQGANNVETLFVPL